MAIIIIAMHVILVFLLLKYVLGEPARNWTLLLYNEEISSWLMEVNYVSAPETAHGADVGKLS